MPTLEEGPGGQCDTLRACREGDWTGRGAVFSSLWQEIIGDGLLLFSAPPAKIGLGRWVGRGGEETGGDGRGREGTGELERGELGRGGVYIWEGKV